jgi:ATP/maltotriose-dependent transcriptional regulator MalT/DNA-binding SARP family transcriptional activator
MAESLEVLSTKTRPPRLGVPLLKRPRLTQAVQQLLRRKFLLLSAEAGYGKTSLLLSAAPDLGLPIAWYTLDEGDSDVNLFAAGLVDAIRRVVADFGEDVLAVLTTGPSLSELRTRLLRALEGLPDILLVLDDFHVADQNPAVQDLVDHLLPGLPPHVHLVIATRTWPHLRELPRLLVGAEAAVLDKNALAFTAEEAAAFFHQSHGLGVDSLRARQLTERTEGWPAALQLVALAARGRGTPDLPGTPREIYDYLATTVLEGLSDEIQEFLLRTSILFELRPSLCQALLDQGNAVTLLETVDRNNLFLYRLDEEGSRFRYHQLFAAFLQQRLARRGSDVIAALHRRAGSHLEAEGVVDQAVRHFFAAGAYEEAERVMKPYHGDRLTARLAYTFREMVTRLPEEVQTRHPWITRTGASSARFVGDYQGGLAFARRAMSAAEGIDPNLWAFSVHGVVVMYAQMDRFEEAVALARQSLSHLDDRIEPRMRSGLLSNLAGCLWQLGRLDETEEVIEELSEVVHQGTQPGRGLGPAFLRGHVACARFAYGLARDHYREALRHAEERGSLSYKAFVSTELARIDIAAARTGEAKSTLQTARRLHEETGERANDLTLTHLAGDLAYLAGDVNAAESHYQQTLAKCRDGESEEPRVWAHLGLVRVARARGTVVEAESLLNAALQIVERVKLGRILPVLLLEQVSLLRATGRSQGALVPLARAREILAAWKSPQGLARCRFLEARLRWDLAGGPTMPAEAAGVLAEALGQAANAPEDLVPFLLAEGWTIDLLIAALQEGIQGDTADGLLAGMGGAAVPALIDGLKDTRLRMKAVRLLGRAGDPRARRPLTRFLAGSDPEVRRAVEAALALLREPEPTELRIFLFGHFEVYRGESRIGEGEWKTQKVKSLLKYLLLHRGRAVHQDELIERFWPEAGARAGAVNLKAAVKNLRLALEPLLEGSRSHFIVREGQTLRFQAGGGCWVDLDAYRRYLDEAHGHERGGRSGEAIIGYEAAVTLYRGDLLNEDIYEDWTAVERERWREAQIDVLASLARLCASEGDMRKAAEFTRRVLELDRLRETAYRDLIRYALLRGDRHGAIRAFQTCERLLREELGVTPEPETLALIEQATLPV